LTNLELLRQFIAECPLIDELTDNIHIDWTAGSSESYGIAPTGQTVTVLEEYINGDVLLQIQEDYSLYCDNWTSDDVARLEQSNFMFRLMDYIRTESYAGRLPFSGELQAQNGSLFEIEEDGQYGKYLIQMNLTYRKEYKR
jgi:hypothetical protein